MGPMTGYPGRNAAAFYDAAERLRERGAIVYSISEGVQGSSSLGALVAHEGRMLDALAVADCVVTLPGSEGALLPGLIVAEVLGVPVVPLVDALDWAPEPLSA